MKNNKQALINASIKKNLTLGCYNPKIENISSKELKKVIGEIGTTDEISIPVNIRNKRHFVEISIIDKEIDFYLLTELEFINTYGEYAIEDLLG